MARLLERCPRVAFGELLAALLCPEQRHIDVDPTRNAALGALLRHETGAFTARFLLCVLLTPSHLEKRAWCPPAAPAWREGWCRGSSQLMATLSIKGGCSSFSFKVGFVIFVVFHVSNRGHASQILIESLQGTGAVPPAWSRAESSLYFLEAGCSAPRGEVAFGADKSHGLGLMT